MGKIQIQMMLLFCSKIILILDCEGKYIILDIEMLGKRITFINLYAPSSGDHPEVVLFCFVF